MSAPTPPSPGPSTRERDPGAELEAPPPLLGRWRNLYLFLVVELLLTAAVLHALTRWAS